MCQVHRLTLQIASCLERDVELQESGREFEIGEDWDELQAEVLASGEFREDKMIQIALRFWDDWGDSANHGWIHHEPMTEELWPQYANEICRCLRQGVVTSNSQIIELFLPKPHKSLLSRLASRFGRGT